MKLSIKVLVLPIMLAGVSTFAVYHKVWGSGSKSASYGSPIVTQTSEGVYFDFSDNPIEFEVHLLSEAPGQEPINEVYPLGKKKVVAASCEGDGNCAVNSSTAPHALKRVVFDDGTAVTF